MSEDGTKGLATDILPGVESVSNRTHRILGAVGEGSPHDIVLSLIHALSVAILVGRQADLEEAVDAVVATLRAEVARRSERWHDGQTH